VSGGNRVERLYDRLTAKERALLVLQAWKEDKEEELGVRWSMPPDQVTEFNRYIDLMNGVNQHLVPFLIAVSLEVEKLSLRLGWLGTLALWGLETWELGAIINVSMKEPVTESEYRELEAKARREPMSVADCAEVLTSRYEDWTDDELQSKKHGIVDPKAWERVASENWKTVRKLIDDGKLPATRKGRKIIVESGAFYDWLGEQAPVIPEEGFEYEVLPDAEAGSARQRRDELRHAREIVAKAPTGLGVGFMRRQDERLAEWLVEPFGDSRREDLVEVKRRLLREGIEEQWRHLRSVEIAVAEVRAAFGDEDPRVPTVAHLFDQSKERLVDVHEGSKDYLDAFELPDPDAELLGRVRRLVGVEGLCPKRLTYEAVARQPASLPQKSRTPAQALVRRPTV
jgi:hypothetical protein